MLRKVFVASILAAPSIGVGNAALSIANNPEFDWLIPVSTSPTTAELRDNSGNVFAVLLLEVTGGEMSGSPLTYGTIDGRHWLNDPMVRDFAQFSDSSIPVSSVRVLPTGGTASYTITIMRNGGASFGDFVVSVGQIAPGTGSEVTISAGTTDPLELVGQYGWDAGLGRFDGMIDWNSDTGALTNSGDTTRDSGTAIVGMEALQADAVTLSFSGTSLAPLGDQIQIGVGTVSTVPEPSVAVFLFCSTSWFLCRRTRRSVP